MTPHDPSIEFELTVTPSLFNRFHSISGHEEYHGGCNEFLTKLKTALHDSPTSRPDLTDAIFGDFHDVDPVTVTVTAGEIEEVSSALERLKNRLYDDAQLLPKYTRDEFLASFNTVELIEAGLIPSSRVNIDIPQIDEDPELEDIDEETIEQVTDSANDAFESVSPLPEDAVVDWVCQQTSVDSAVVYTIIQDLGDGGTKFEPTIDTICDVDEVNISR